MVNVDKTGKWYINTGLFRLPHGLRPEVNFEPGVPVRIDPDDWIAGQPTLEVMEDPTGEEEITRAEGLKKAAKVEKNGPEPTPKA